MMRRRTAFTLVELLMVIAIIGILAGLLMPALGAIRANGQSAACKNNLEQMARAKGSEISKTGRNTIDPKDWTTIFGKQLEGQDGVFRCPSIEADGYAMQALGGVLDDADDGYKILILDYAPGKKVAEVVGRKTKAADRAAHWVPENRASHAGQINLLKFNGSVTTMQPDDIDPTVDELHEQYWLPFRKDVDRIDPVESLPKGIWAEYRLGIENFTGAPDAVRTDPDFKFPFGVGDNHQADPLPPRTGNLMSAKFNGMIKAPQTGTYIFWVSHDDGCTVKVNSNMVYSLTGWQWNGVGIFSQSSPISMEGDVWVPIEVTLTNYNGPYHIQIQWSGPGMSQTDIPSANLRAKQAQ